MTTTTKNFLVFALFFSLLGFMATFVPAYAHDGEDHGAEEEAAHSDDHDTDRIKIMQALIAVLNELIELLTEQVAHSGGHADADDHGTEQAHLQITVEEHGGTTHVHVYEGGEETHSFFLEALALHEQEAIIAAIAEQTQMDTAAVAAAATFPSDSEDEHADDHEDDHEEGHDDETDLEGIHIMGDGTVMLGNGEVLPGATVTEEGMIKLEDGTLVEPEYDLRQIAHIE